MKVPEMTESQEDEAFCIWNGEYKCQCGHLLYDEDDWYEEEGRYYCKHCGREVR